jgi:uncharacterized protein YuzE
METLNISEKKEKLTWNYDAEADILYISFGGPTIAEGVDIGDGTIIRIQPDTQEIVGLTILSPVHRTVTSLKNISLSDDRIKMRPKPKHTIKKSV